MAKFHAEDYIQFLQSVTPENKVHALCFPVYLTSSHLLLWIFDMPCLQF